jgi:ribose transport system substrate-binding protein
MKAKLSVALKRWPLILLVSVCCSIVGCPGASAQQGSQGITKLTALPPFEATERACARPPNLERVLVFAQDNEREFMQGVEIGLAAAAKDRGLQFRTAKANNSSAKMISDVQQMVRAHVGSLVVSPVDPAALSPSLQEMIWSGAYVGAVVPPPATSVLNAPQYLTGKVLGEAAATYIRTKLGGKANVVLLTHDRLQFLAPRFTAIRDALRNLPGVVIVADISPATVDEAGGASMMRTILLANPDIDVVLGADTVVLGALDALRAAGKARRNQFLGGIDGEPRAIAEIKEGGPYKVSVSLASPIFSYAMGQHAADWLEGKYVPQAMDILPFALTLENIARYEADVANPGPIYADPERRASYLRMYGGICYDTRDQYINFPWSSERK